MTSLGGQLVQSRLDLGNVLGGGLRLPAEQGDVAQHWRFRAYPIASRDMRQRALVGEGGTSRASGSSASATAESWAADRRLPKCSRIPRRWTGWARRSRALPAAVKVAKVPRRAESQRVRSTRPA